MLKPERDAAPSHTAEDPGIGILQFALLSASARAHSHLLSTDELLAQLPGLPSEWKNKIDRLRAKHEIQARERYELVVERRVSDWETDLGPKLSYEGTQAVLYVIWRDAIELFRAIGEAYLSGPAANLNRLLEDIAMLVIRDSNALMRQVSGGTWFQVASDAKPPRTDAAGSQPAAVSDEEERPATHEEIRLLCWLAESGADPCRCAQSAEFSSDLRDRLIQQPSLSVGEVGRQILEEKARRSSGVTSFTVDQFGRFIPVEAADVGTSARREEIGPELPPLEPYRMDSDWWSPALAENLMKAIEPELQDLTKTGRYRRYHGTEAEAAPQTEQNAPHGEYKRGVVEKVNASTTEICTPTARANQRKAMWNEVRKARPNITPKDVYYRAFPDLKRSGDQNKARGRWVDWLSGSYVDEHEYNIRIVGALGEVEIEESSSSDINKHTATDTAP